MIPARRMTGRSRREGDASIDERRRRTGGRRAATLSGSLPRPLAALRRLADAGIGGAFAPGRRLRQAVRRTTYP